MFKKKIRSASWYPYAIAACIAVTLYVVLAHAGTIYRGVRKVTGYFSPVVVAIALAYLMNPLAKFYSTRVLRRIRREKLNRVLSNVMAVLTVILVLALAVMLVIPQLMDSLLVLSENLDDYMKALEETLSRWGIFAGKSGGTLKELLSSSENILDKVLSYVGEHITAILTTGVGGVRQLVSLVIAFILSIYLLSEKKQLKKGIAHLMQLLLKQEVYERTCHFLSRCDAILTRYIVYNLLDSLIVGVSTGIFMAVAGMPFGGLVSFLVALTNLVPTFGPVVGAAFGAFILVLVKPVHALIFIIFSFILQTVDGYVIKPRLIGGSLGVSGVWVLVGIIVGDRMFGVLGILLAIPACAILDFLYREHLLPWLEQRKGKAGKKGGPAPSETLPEGEPPREAAEPSEADPDAPPASE